MNKTIRIDLHCHSSHSDGALSPEQLADALSAAGVRYAALTDHDTLAGQEAFRQALARHSIGCLAGLEITALYNSREIHLLAYGFDPDDAGLNKELASIRTARDPNSPRFSPNQVLSAAETISLVHQAGGIIVLAHPALTEPDQGKLQAMAAELKTAGLDGLEALYGMSLPAERERLTALAGSLGLLVSAGSDHHSRTNTPPHPEGMEMPVALWKQFRDAALASSSVAVARSAQRPLHKAPDVPDQGHWRRFVLHIIVPAFLSMALFAAALFFIFLPAFENSLLDRKREMIHELTSAAWGVLAEAAREEQSGGLARGQAQALAKERIKAMRYGREAKDYFWLQDTVPRMVMHPYRPDLDGKDLSDFTDARGVRIFIAFADTVKLRHEGYVSYVWQWKDDPRRLEPKESYIRLFKPWGWIIGTGIYVNDVREETDVLLRRLMTASAVIAVLVLLLLLFVMRESLLLERRRTRAERALSEAADKYRTLSEAATEGALFMRNGQCRYANQVMLGMVGCSAQGLELLDTDDLFPDTNDNRRIRELLVQGALAGRGPKQATGFLQRLDKNLLECSFTVRAVAERATDAVMVLVRRGSTAGDRVSPAPRQVLERLLHLPASAAEDLAALIAAANQSGDIISLCQKTPALVRSLLETGAHASAIARMLSFVSDAATRRFIELAAERLGPAPAPYVFLALGSQGRREQTLFTDQDNALIYTPAEGSDESAVQSYFIALATEVCDGLSRCGYRDCKGKVMASNPRWCRPLPEWKRYFEEWVTRAEPHELMEFSIFFDFRSVAGSEPIAAELRTHVSAVLENAFVFFSQAAQNALLFKPPMRFFGAIVTAGSKSGHPGKLDLKKASMPLVSFARLYSLRHSLIETGTLERLDALTRAGVITESKRNDIATVHESLLRIRLRHQSTAIEKNLEPDNLIDPDLLGHIEEAVLRECFTEIENMQARIQRDFLGGQ